MSTSPLSHNNATQTRFAREGASTNPSGEFGLNRRRVWEGFEVWTKRGENVSQWNQETGWLEIMTISYWRRESLDSGSWLNYLKSLQTIFSQQSKTDGWWWPPKTRGGSEEFHPRHGTSREHFRWNLIKPCQWSSRQLHFQAEREYPAIQTAILWWVLSAFLFRNTLPKPINAQEISTPTVQFLVTSKTDGW